MGAFGTVLLVASRSLRYRLSGVLLTIASVALSVFVLLGVEHVRRKRAQVLRVPCRVLI